MNNTKDVLKPVSFLTVGELITILKDEINSPAPEPQIITPSEKRFEYSTKSASKRLGISTTTFQNWKNKKLFSYTQVNRKCIYDIPLIMKELTEYKQQKNRKYHE